MEISILLAVFILPPLTFALHSAYCFYLNYQIARKIGIPIVYTPVSPDNPIWALTSQYILPVIRRIFGDFDAIRFWRVGWEYPEKNRPFEDSHEDALVLVTPGHNWVHICNADAFNDIFRRRDDFYRPPEMLAMLDVFGPNISTANGADWQRQRKITSAPFNEQNNSLVWRESLRQGSELLSLWKASETPIRATAKDFKTFALHVLSGAGFGKSYSFQKGAEPPKPGHEFNYKDSLCLILENALLILVFGPEMLKKNWMPKTLRRLGQATVDFKFYMTELLNDEKAAIASGHPGNATITNSLIQASEEVSRQTGVKKEGRALKGLTEEEIYGNIFVYNFAGHDTTATTFNWALYLLAANPEVQEWIAEEIAHVIGDDENGLENYNQNFPKLNRCLAVFLETLRLWNPLIGIAKQSSNTPQPLKLGTKEIIIPPLSRVIPNINAIHSHTRYWGEDSKVWRPSRWIKIAEGSGPQIDRESMFTPVKGSYVPFSDGARVCPGKKFAQVEFVAAMVAFFRENRVRVVQEGGESESQARERTMAVVKDSGILLLLQMNHPEKVGLKWVTAGK